MSKDLHKEVVDPKIYDTDYYLYDGYSSSMEKFISTLDDSTHLVAYPMKLANLQDGERVLDIGCGTGKLAYMCAKNGCVVDAYDYSADAITIAKECIKRLPDEFRENLHFKNGDIKDISPTRQYDVIFMLDVVEHLYDWELEVIFNKIRKLLGDGRGRLIIHTAPNRWHINFIYPLKRFLCFPKVIFKKQSFFYKRSKYFYDPEMHVNEQTPLSLKRHLKGFDTKIWCEDGSSNAISILTRKFCGCDIWAIAKIKRS